MVTFSTWVADSGQSHEAVADQIGVSRAYITQLVGGKKTPSIEIVRRMLAVSNGALSAEALIHEFTRE